MENQKINLVKLTLMIDFDKGSNIEKEVHASEYNPKLKSYSVESKDHSSTFPLQEKDIMNPIMVKTENALYIEVWCREDMVESAKKEVLATADKEFLKLQNTFIKIKNAFKNIFE